MAENTFSSRLIHYLREFISVIIYPQTYRNLVYLLLMLPLGMLYLMVITMFPLAISLIPLIIGVPLLLVVMVITTQLVTFDRWITKRLLGIDIPVDNTRGRSVLHSADDRSESRSDTRSEGWARLTDRSMWSNYLISIRELIYLGSKHLFGNVAWLVVIVGLTTGLVFLLSPIHYRYPIIGIHISEDIQFIPEFIYQHDIWQVDFVLPFIVNISKGEVFSNYIGSAGALLLAVTIGIFLTLFALHIINGTAQLYGKFAKLMLQSRNESNS